MTTSMDAGTLAGVLEWAWERALEGLPGWDTAEELAGELPGGTEAVEARIDELIASQKRRAVTAGFLTGLGGAAVLPLALPASEALALFVRLRLIAAIAHLRGYNLHDERVKALGLACLGGAPAADILREIGVSVVSGAGNNSALCRLPPELFQNVASRLGARLLSGFGGRGLLGLGKAIPLIGGLLGGLADGSATKTAAENARAAFPAVRLT